MAGHDRVVRDNVHRDIVLDDDISRLVDTRIAAPRCQTIVPVTMCSHNYTLDLFTAGAQHLAGILLKHLETVNPGRISPEDARLVRFAALLHDISHPPFSHALESDKVFATYHHHKQGKKILQNQTMICVWSCLISSVKTDWNACSLFLMVHVNHRFL